MSGPGFWNRVIGALEGSRLRGELRQRILDLVDSPDGLQNLLECMRSLHLATLL